MGRHDYDYGDNTITVIHEEKDPHPVLTFIVRLFILLCILLFILIVFNLKDFLRLFSNLGSMSFPEFCRKFYLFIVECLPFIRGPGGTY